MRRMWIGSLRYWLSSVCCLLGSLCAFGSDFVLVYPHPGHEDTYAWHQLGSNQPATGAVCDVGLRGDAWVSVANMPSNNVASEVNGFAATNAVENETVSTNAAATYLEGGSNETRNLYGISNIGDSGSFAGEATGTGTFAGMAYRGADKVTEVGTLLSGAGGGGDSMTIHLGQSGPHSALNADVELMPTANPIVVSYGSWIRPWLLLAITSACFWWAWDGVVHAQAWIFSGQQTAGLSQSAHGYNAVLPTGSGYQLALTGAIIGMCAMVGVFLGTYVPTMTGLRANITPMGSNPFHGPQSAALGTVTMNVLSGMGSMVGRAYVILDTFVPIMGSLAAYGAALLVRAKTDVIQVGAMLLKSWMIR